MSQGIKQREIKMKTHRKSSGMLKDDEVKLAVVGAYSFLHLRPEK